jgi:O-antigen/teichoic acid export membrane protein
MEAFALAQTMNLVFALLIVMPKLHFSIQWQHMRELVLIGFPCIWGFWGYCILQGASRYVLQIMVSEEEAGFYFLGSNLGRVIELPLWGFLSAWVPLFNSYLHKQDEAPTVFSKIMTYYVLGMSCFAAAFFCFARPVAYHLLQPAFYNVWTIVGLSSIAQALWGVYGITYPALIFHKKTGLQSCIELGAGALCILLNCLLASYLFKEGAAMATAFGFFGLVLASVYCNQKLLYVPYELPRLLKVVAGLTSVAALSFLPIESQIVYMSVMIPTWFAYLVFAWYGILTRDERSSIRETIQKKFFAKPSTLSP